MLTRTKELVSHLFSPPPLHKSSYDEDFQHAITNKQEIFSKLSEIKNAKQLVIIYGQNSSFCFQSMIIEINQKKQILLLDLPVDIFNHSNIPTNSTISLKCNFRGIFVYFSTTITRQSDYEQRGLIRLNIPNLIHWKELRSNKRVKIPERHFNTFILLAIINNETMSRESQKFRIQDLSAKGFSLINSSNFSLLPQNNQKPYNGLLCLENHDSFAVSFSIRHINNKKTGSRTIQNIGCCFTNIDFKQESEIQKYIQSIELESNRLIRARL